ncbi:hypothetical protein C2E23DRAFT_76602 [Lenzites betulinus]|nr:hypothetical protein C2E23DRAFT_76602 [Lenzites betulinus]
MAYFKSGMRRSTLDSTTGSRYFWLWNTPPREDRAKRQDEEAIIGSYGSYDAWCWGADRLQDRDSELIKTWADQADGLVTFAALFSGVVTSFILQSYTVLLPDPQMITIDLLRQIVAHLDGNNLQAVLATSNTAPFEPALADVVLNAALFASLICSLLAAGMGIFYKEWLREYNRGTPTNPRELMRVRQHRYLGMRTWRMQEILSTISIFLQFGVGFFIISVVLFAWSLHPIVRLVLNVFAIIWVVFWIGTAFCPLVSNNCPFRSPLSRTIFTATYFAKWLLRRAGLRSASSEHITEDGPMLRTLEHQEQITVDARGSILDTGALYYLYTDHWGDPHLAALDACIEDLPKTEALHLVGVIIACRCPSNTSPEKLLAGTEQVEDADVMRLVNLWRRLKEQGDMPPSVTMPPRRGPGFVRPPPTRRPPMHGRDTTLVGECDVGDSVSMHTINEEDKHNDVATISTVSTSTGPAGATGRCGVRKMTV